MIGDLLPQVLASGRNVGHVFVQDVFLGADAVIIDVLGPVQLTHVKVKGLRETERNREKRETEREFKPEGVVPV